MEAAVGSEEGRDEPLIPADHPQEDPSQDAHRAAPAERSPECTISTNIWKSRCSTGSVPEITMSTPGRSPSMPTAARNRLLIRFRVTAGPVADLTA